MPKFVPRQRKHKVLRRTNGGKDATPALDSNALELLPASQREREEKRRKLKEELRAQQPKMSGKKQKRLDKYIVSVIFVCVETILMIARGSGDEAQKGRKSGTHQEIGYDQGRYDSFKELEDAG